MEQEYRVIEGYVEHIRFRNEANGYTVFNCETRLGDWTCLGIFPFISEGQYLELTGQEFDNATYNEIQFRVAAYEEKQPEDQMGMERYLSSGAIKGIGPNLAKKIVKKFKLDTFRIIEEEPERLAEIKGISERMAISVATQFRELKDMREAMLYLGKFQIPNHYAVKIYNTYGDELYQIVKENPYRLAEDITGIGFRTADEIARRVGIDANSQFRVAAGLVYTMTQAGAYGHVYLPREILLEKARGMLGIAQEAELLEDCLADLIMQRRLIAVQAQEQVRLYAPTLYYSELDTARMLLTLAQAYEGVEQPDDLPGTFPKLEQELGIVLNDLQKKAVQETIRHGVTIITGGPGTGKTTIINAVIRYFEMEGLDIMLAAPTGRAAKRMKEATGCEAKTIHRLLEISGDPAGDTHYKFERDRSNPLETDVVIIDEASMVDISLMHSLLQAIASGTRLVLVGDVNQLPSVGPGNVLKDMIASDLFSTVCLSQIYRQEEGSRIVSNAHRINAGESIPLDNKSRDFFLMPRSRADEVVNVTIALVRDKLPGYQGVSPQEVQVLAPTRKGEVGVQNLNSVLQRALNPPAPDKKEHEAGRVVYREGDKVMQVRNNYKLEWVKQEPDGQELDSGTGVFNGDMGIITQISDYAEEVTVEFDEGHIVKYPYGFLDELELAYAVTVHKSQGSEYPVVVLPLLSGPPVLYTRNLLYTAVTRARKCVVIVGDLAVMEQMIRNNTEQKRYSGLCEAICSLAAEEE